jgi:ATP adenylyltransferase
VEGHVHTHVVPRWNGDTNFMPVFSDTRVLPEALASTYAQLKEKMELTQNPQKNNSSPKKHP